MPSLPSPAADRAPSAGRTHGRSPPSRVGRPQVPFAGAPVRSGRPIPLFWRLFVPNAVVLTVACLVLWAAPANGRIAILAAGLLTMLAINLVLMRRAAAPLERLTELMRNVDPLHPGRRIPVIGPASEVTELARSFNEMLDRVESERRDSARRALSAQESERRHLAAELHDEIGQTISAQVLQLTRVLPHTDGEVRAQLEEAVRTAECALEDVRRVARHLRPEALDDLGLVPALTSLCDRVARQMGLTVTRRLERDLPMLSADEELVVYRVAQESLTNVARHSGASRAEVHLSAGRDGVVLVVRDDGEVGVGDGAKTSQGGIRGMRERALLIGAHLTIGPGRQGGTEVRLELPVESGS